MNTTKQSHRGADAPRARRRLRRHRHQPALRGEGDLQPRARHPAHARRTSSAALSAIFWVADDRGLAEVRDAGAAREQPRRGRHHGAARARDVGRSATGRGWSAPLLAIGVFGAALFYGDAVLTPAISVLSAVEGLEVGTAAFKPYVVPIATGILVGAVPDPEARHRRRRACCSARCARCGSRRSPPPACGTSRRARRSSRRSNPLHALALRHRARRRVVRRAGLGAARDHRRRGAVRRHGALRQARDPHRLVRRWSRRRWCSTTSARARC